MLPEKDKMDETMEPKKGAGLEKLPNGPVISYRSGWRGGGVGWGKEGF